MTIESPTAFNDIRLEVSQQIECRQFKKLELHTYYTLRERSRCWMFNGAVKTYIFKRKAYKFDAKAKNV
jgi:hypothetical protein